MAHEKGVTTSLARRFERITGIKAAWLPEVRRMKAILPGTVSVPWFTADGDQKDAFDTLLVLNLERIRTERMKRIKGRCENCGRIRGLDLHHKQHRSAGRDDRPDNLILLCRGCHSLQHS